MTQSNAWRWTLGLLIVIAIVGLLAYARGKPGAGGRAPDPEHANPVTLIAPAHLAAPRSLSR